MLMLFAVVFIAKSQNSKLIDKRAFNYYTEKEINEMPVQKIKEINFLFTKSFIIPEEFKSQINVNDVDGFKYGMFRKEHEQVKVMLDIEKELNQPSNKYIILLSFDEVNREFEAIRDNNAE
jgi:ribulose bisphosphate carboxylase small subunit